MGIRGLSTYIKLHSHKFLEDIQLHDTILIIDGNNLMFHLYTHPPTHCISCFGGDYHVYTQCCEKFFKLLTRCKIRPLVIFDGGHEKKKLDTIKKRLRNKIHMTRNISPSKDMPNFPLLLKENFLSVLIKMNIDFVQTLFEADDIIASLAKKLNCPILSNDSDFFIYDVQYIPFPSLKHQIKINQETKTSYIPAQKYSIDYFLESFGGLNKDMLPLLATILGNDYIKRSTFSNFFSQIKMPKGKKYKNFTSQKIIVGVLEWLRNEDLNSAKEKILNTLPKEDRKIILRNIDRVMKGYNNNPNIQEYTSALKSLDTLELFETDEENNQIKCLDPYFKKLFQSGKFPTYFMDILSLNSVHWAPQIEDFTQPFSQEISLSIFQIILGILLKNETNNGLNIRPVNLFIRGDKYNMRCRKIEPIFVTGKNTNLPMLSEIENLTLSEKIKIIEDSFHLNNVDILDEIKVPSEWAIYFIAIDFWMQKSQDLNLSIVYSLIICLIFMYIVLTKCRHIQNHKHFLKIYGKHLEKRIEELKTNDQIENDISLAKGIPDSINSVTMDDCVLFVDKFIQFQEVNKILLTRPQLYNQRILHTVAQFHSCLQMAIHLNALLNFPLPQCPIEKIFSGTFIYNLYEFLYIRGDVDQYLESILKTMPTLYNIFQKIKSIFIGDNSKLFKQNLVAYSKKKRRKNRSTFSIPIKETLNKFETLRISEN